MNFKLIPCLVWLCTSLSRLNCSIPPYHTNKQYVLINLVLIFNHNIDYCSCCCCCSCPLCCLFFSCTAKERWPRALCFISRLSSIAFCFCTFITYELLWCYLRFFLISLRNFLAVELNVEKCQRFRFVFFMLRLVKFSILFLLFFLKYDDLLRRRLLGCCWLIGFFCACVCVGFFVCMCVLVWFFFCLRS